MEGGIDHETRRQVKKVRGEAMKPLIEGGIVIIGGGQAGGWAAKTLRDQGYQGRLSVISDEPHDFYERPPLSKAALVQENTTLSRLFSEEETKALNLTWYRPIRATGIDSEKKQVQLSDGRGLTFDKLLIATGGRPRYLSSAWQSHPQYLPFALGMTGKNYAARYYQPKKLPLLVVDG